MICMIYTDIYDSYILSMVAAYLCKLTRVFHIMKKKKKEKNTLISIPTIHLHEGEYKAIEDMYKYG